MTDSEVLEDIFRSVIEVEDSSDSSSDSEEDEKPEKRKRIDPRDV